MVEPTELASLITLGVKIVERTQNPLSKVKMSSLKCCAAKSAAQVSTQLSGNRQWRFEWRSCNPPLKSTHHTVTTKYLRVMTDCARKNRAKSET